jgi:hypothetical protein
MTKVPLNKVRHAIDIYIELRLDWYVGTRVASLRFCNSIKLKNQVIQNMSYEHVSI